MIEFFNRKESLLSFKKIFIQFFYLILCYYLNADIVLMHHIQYN